VDGKGRKRDVDPLERNTRSAARLDERDPAKDGAAVTALVPARSACRDEPLRLVEAERRRSDTAPSRHFADRQLAFRHLT
jgi:hypothetical protein